MKLQRSSSCAATVILTLFLCGTYASPYADGFPSCPEPPEDSTSLLQATVQTHGGRQAKKAAPRELGKDTCSCASPMLASSKPDWNVTAALPVGLEMKHAGWTSDFINKGIGVFASRPFAKGEEIGSSLVQAVPCRSATAHTPVGEWVVMCAIHFHLLHNCGANEPADAATNAKDLHAFASWISFLNGNGVSALNDLDHLNHSHSENMSTSSGGRSIHNANSDTNHYPDANVVFGSPTCKHSTQETEWHLMASKDIAIGQELLMQYDWRAGQEPMPDPMPDPMPAPDPMPT